MVYALERELYLGSTFAVFIELSEGRDVSGGPVPRVWNLTSNGLPLDQPLQRDRRVYFRDLEVGELNAEEPRFRAARRVV